MWYLTHLLGQIQWSTHCSLWQPYSWLPQSIFYLILSYRWPCRQSTFITFCQVVGQMHNSISINRLFPQQVSKFNQMYHLSKEALHIGTAFLVLKAVYTWKRQSPLQIFFLKIVCIIAYKFLHNATFSYEHTQAAFVLQMYACKIRTCTSKTDKELHKFKGFWHNLVWFSIFKYLALCILNIMWFMLTLKSGTFTVNILCSAREGRDMEPLKICFLDCQGFEKLCTACQWNVSCWHIHSLWVVAVNVKVP